MSEPKKIQKFPNRRIDMYYSQRSMKRYLKIM